ncbi:MAG: hypothetical protein R2704_17735 [Microthrixaceae bacterium]
MVAPVEEGDDTVVDLMAALEATWRRPRRNRKADKSKDEPAAESA